MYRGSLIIIEDLSNGQIEDILDLAQEIQHDPDTFYGLASRRIMASLFLEPSTRTRGSFEAAMKRLGGDVITTADASSSSMAKGESLADTARVWSGYSDLIVIRHPWEGAARLAAEYSDVPVINAGDGSHEHPTQTLLDLYTLRKELGALRGRKIVLCGDLKHGRTIHSLIYALLRFGAVVILASGEGLELPDHVKHKMEVEYKKPIQKIRHAGIEALYGKSAGNDGAVVDAIYMTPSEPHSLTLFGSIRFSLDKDESLAFYVTRRQVERDAKGEDGLLKRYPRIDAKVLNRPDFSNAVILHPLPRVDELSTEVDSDPRSKYFDQARNGVPVRMALIALMLGLKPWGRHSEGGESAKEGLPVFSPKGVRCLNPECVVRKEPGSTEAEFTFFYEPRFRFVCSYCERETLPVFCAYPWGEVYHLVERISPALLEPSRFSFFQDEASAQATGLRRPKRHSTGSKKVESLGKLASMGEPRG